MFSKTKFSFSSKTFVGRCFACVLVIFLSVQPRFWYCKQKYTSKCFSFLVIFFNIFMYALYKFKFNFEGLQPYLTVLLVLPLVFELVKLHIQYIFVVHRNFLNWLPSQWTDLYYCFTVDADCSSLKLVCVAREIFWLDTVHYLVSLVFCQIF